MKRFNKFLILALFLMGAGLFTTKNAMAVSPTVVTVSTVVPNGSGNGL